MVVITRTTKSRAAPSPRRRCGLFSLSARRDGCVCLVGLGEQLHDKTIAGESIINYLENFGWKGSSPQECSGVFVGVVPRASKPISCFTHPYLGSARIKQACLSRERRHVILTRAPDDLIARRSPSSSPFSNRLRSEKLLKASGDSGIWKRKRILREGPSCTAAVSYPSISQTAQTQTRNGA